METQKCPLCQRELGEINISKHHLIPKSKGGTFGETVMLHNICHQKIHSVFSEKELRDDYNTIEKLLAHEQIAKFVKWVAKKEIGFYERNKRMKKK
ncbi:MAG: HNH endonuclease [Bacteroidota bacterium]